ncbi:MAG: InlB B-repeat-containing protein, partial [Caldilineaceae bacterium]|nr:InlB B-repeat-containing protein [Caldilineaceae bacterium]
AGEATAFDPNSLRVVEIDASGQVIDNSVPFQFDDPTCDDSNRDGAGTLVFLLRGTTAVNAGRTYHIYFDVVGKGFTLPNFTDQVVLTDNVTDQGQSSFQITTANATYYYHKAGGGFSSLVDSDNKDWIDYRRNIAGAGGTFRGIPNMIYPEGEFHPGATGSSSAVVSSGPLKETIRTVTSDSKWEALWELFPTYARMTVLKYDHDYWFLYEGTPGGTFDAASDFLVRSNGTQNLLSADWQADLTGEEWVYVGDPNSNRSIFLAHHEDDSAVDSYKPLNNLMTVFGFGRQNSPTASKMNQQPGYFTIGLIDELSYTPAAKQIRGAYKDLVVTAAPLQIRGQHRTTIPAASAVVSATMTSNRALTATFRPLIYTLDWQSTGQGTVAVSPDKPTYNHGDVVTLTASPDPGWRLGNWSGALSGNTTPETLTMDGNKTVTANFVRIPYTIDTIAVGSGTVTATPANATYFYGDEVTLTAAANPGWSFAGWRGALSGTTPSQQLTVSANHVVTATFVQESYHVITNVVGNGTVSYTPVQASYLYGDEVTFRALPAAGWEFAGWAGDLSGNTTPIVATMTGNRAVTARFTQKEYTLVLTQTGQGQVTAAPQTESYLYGAEVTLTATPAAGWRFVGWSGDLTSTTSPTTIVIEENRAVHATFEPIPYTLTVQQIAGGSVTWSPLKSAYLYGDQVELVATPDADFVFVGWEGALSGDANPAQLTITDNATVSAKFTKTPYTLTTSVVGSGTVTRSPQQENYQQGDEVTLTAIPAAGWRFAGWSGDLTGTTSPATVTVSGNLSITAQFVKDAYTIFLSTESQLGVVSIAPQKPTYEYGDEITLTATPKPGYRFVRWVVTRSDSRTFADNPLLLTIEDDLVITPEFTESGEPVNYLYVPFVANE